MKRSAVTGMGKILLAGACCIALPAALWADTAVRVFFTAGERASVKKGAIISRATLAGGEGFNLPAEASIILPRSRHIPRELSGYEMLAEERAFFPYAMNPPRALSLYNSLFAFSKFAGIRYYSRTDRKLLTYILSSSRIASPGGGGALPDPVYGVVEPRRSCHFAIRDNRFGDITFSHEVLADGDTFVVKSVCVHQLRKMGFTIAGAEEYRLTSMFLYSPADRGFYYYGLHALRVRTGFFTSSGLLNAESFANRLRAETVRRAGLLGLDWSAKIRP